MYVTPDSFCVWAKNLGGKRGWDVSLNQFRRDDRPISSYFDASALIKRAAIKIIIHSPWYERIDVHCRCAFVFVFLQSLGTKTTFRLEKTRVFTSSCRPATSTGWKYSEPVTTTSASTWSKQRTPRGYRSRPRSPSTCLFYLNKWVYYNFCCNVLCCFISTLLKWLSFGVVVFLNCCFMACLYSAESGVANRNSTVFR